MIAAGEVKPDARKSLLAIVAMLSVVTVAILLFSLIKPERLYSAVGAMTILAAAISGMMIASKYANGSKEAIKGMISVGVLLIIIAGVIYGMCELGVDSKTAFGTAIALGILMLALASSLAIISKVKDLDSKTNYGALYYIWRFSYYRCYLIFTRYVTC